LRKNCAEFGVRLHSLGDVEQGIVHVVGPQLGITQPGMTIVCGDSHTSTHGAFGALAFGIGTSEVEHVLATQTLPLIRPKTMAINVDGTLKAGVTSKDIILAVIAKIGADAKFDKEVNLNADELAPFVTWGTNPGQGLPLTSSVPNPADFANAEDRGAAERALEYMDLKPGTPLKSIKVDTIFLGSCTNGRIEDLRSAASIIKGKKIASSVRLLVVPGSARVRLQAESEGLDKVFLDAGGEWRSAGCSMCLGMNPDQLKPGERAASTSNRNFEGRQGNQPQYPRASILVAGPDVGTGSSREHAVWALQNYGFKVVLSSRFADIFRGNSQKMGLLTVILTQEEIEQIWQVVESKPDTQITVDLASKTITYAGKTLSFAIDDYTRWRLMEGLDDIGLTFTKIDAVTTFEEKRASFKPKTLPIK